MAIMSFPIIINLNVNRLNSPIKIHRLAERIKKNHLIICCLQKSHFRYKDMGRSLRP